MFQAVMDLYKEHAYFGMKISTKFIIIRYVGT